MSLSLLAFFAIVFILVYMLRMAKIGAMVAFLLVFYLALMFLICLNYRIRGHSWVIWA